MSITKKVRDRVVEVYKAGVRDGKWDDDTDVDAIADSIVADIRAAMVRLVVAQQWDTMYRVAVMPRRLDSADDRHHPRYDFSSAHLRGQPPADDVVARHLGER